MTSFIAERRNTYVIGERNHTRAGAVKSLMNLHHSRDLRSQRVNGGTATWASSSRLRGYCDHPKAFLTGHMKHWLALTRRRLSQSAETLDGRPKTTVQHDNPSNLNNQRQTRVCGAHQLANGSVISKSIRGIDATERAVLNQENVDRLGAQFSISSR